MVVKGCRHLPPKSLPPPERPDYASTLQQFVAGLRAGEGSASPYSNNVYGGRRAVLESNFPALHRVLGAALFQPLAVAYAKHYPSRDWDINLYGELFPQLLAAQVNSPRADEVDWQALAQLAALEYIMLRCYYARGGANSAALTVPLEQWQSAAGLTQLAAALRAGHPFARLQVDAPDTATAKPCLQATVARRDYHIQVQLYRAEVAPPCRNRN